MAKIAEHMKFEYLRALRSKNASWRLLASAQASFVAAFFYQMFIAENRRAIAETELLARLDDFIYEIHQYSGEEQFTRSPKDYLEMWVDAEHAWLRRFYIQDEPHVDLTSAAQKAIEWLYGLKQQTFIGTESRLRTVLDLLGQIAQESDSDPVRRLALLEEQKAALERKIIEAKAGKIEVLDDVQIKERFIQASMTAQSILADFREVEENFRQLERDMLDKIVTWTHGKGDLLEEIFAQKDGIVNSEQGKSFASFWQFLMLSSQQDDFKATLAKVLHLNSLQEFSADINLAKINRDWFEAASNVQQTIAVLSKQIRRYVDENFLAEERRIFALIQEIETQAVAVRESPPKQNFIEMDDLHAEVNLPMDRPLFVPPKQVKLATSIVEAGLDEIAVDALFSQVYVDKVVLQRNIDTLLRTHPQVTLAQVVQAYPLKKGLTELLAYMVIASKDKQDSFQEDIIEEVLLEDISGKKLLAAMQQIVFSRT